MPTIFNPQWRDQQTKSNYPFVDNATRMSAQGVKLPKDVFLDMSLYPPGNTAQLHLTEVHVSTGGATIYFGVPGTTRLCSASFSTLSPPETVVIRDMFNRPAGVIVSEPIRLSAFQTWRPGVYTFAQQATLLVPLVCIPRPESGVQAVRTEDGDLFVGEVILYGEKGIVLRKDPSSTDDVAVIRVDIIGEPLFLRAACETEDTPYPGRNYLRSINHIPADDAGNFMINTSGHISPDNILRIYPTADGLRFEAVGQRI